MRSGGNDSYFSQRIDRWPCPPLEADCTAVPATPPDHQRAALLTFVASFSTTIVSRALRIPLLCRGSWPPLISSEVVQVQQTSFVVTHLRLFPPGGRPIPANYAQFVALVCVCCCLVLRFDVGQYQYSFGRSCGHHSAFLRSTLPLYLLLFCSVGFFEVRVPAAKTVLLFRSSVFRVTCLPLVPGSRATLPLVVPPNSRIVGSVYLCY